MMPTEEIWGLSRMPRRRVHRQSPFSGPSRGPRPGLCRIVHRNRYELPRIPHYTTVVAAAVLAVGLVAWGCVVAIQLLRLRSWGTMSPDLRGAFVLRVALGQVATLPLVIAGVAVLAGGLYWLVPGTVFPILVALFAVWELLVEINR
jgi:hypothetical protein